MNFCFLFPIIFPLLLSAKNVLYLGDSQAIGPFGSQFDKLLRQNKFQVNTYGSCGSTLKWWHTGQATTCGYFEKNDHGIEIRKSKNNTPRLIDLLQSEQPDIVVLQFGGNYLSYLNEEILIEEIRQTLDLLKLRGLSCFWISNPDTRKYRDKIPKLSSSLKKAINGTCHFFESYLITNYPMTGGDGVHYSFQAGVVIAHEWAQKAFESFQLFTERVHYLVNSNHKFSRNDQSTIFDE